jgi:hypothetical protein
MGLKFYDRTLKRIGRVVPSRKSEEVDDAERILGLKIPAAIREWYSAIDGRSILEKYSNDDHALPPAEFELVTDGEHRLVKFMIENQGVCWWGFPTDERDDPPVYVNMDAPPDNIFEYSSCFTEFVYTRVFDYDRFWDGRRCSMDICDPLTIEDISFLESEFETEPQSGGWPVITTYRFSSRLGRITIWAGDQQSDWIMSANSPEELAALRESIIHLWRGHVG